MTNVIRAQALSAPFAINYSGIYIAADDAQIIVDGNVYALEGPALHVVGDRADIDLFSTVSNLYGVGLMAEGDDVDIRIRMDGSAEGELIGVHTTGKNTTINSEGGIFGFTGVLVEGLDDGQADRLTVINSGVISALGTGIGVTSGDGLDRLVVQNSGHILIEEDPAEELDGDAIAGSSAADFVRNRGYIEGHVSLGDGDDIYRGAGGSIDGVIDGGLGNDTIGGGAEDNRIQGGGGADVIYGGDGADSLSSSWGNDRVFGGLGGDTIDAGAGADVAWGGSGFDLIDMGKGADTAYGGAGDDTILAGGDGGDKLFGGAGDDVIVSTGGGWDKISGGFGNDTMTGGGGQDRFDFILSDGADVITDFTDAEDLLDLTAFGTDFDTMETAEAFSDTGSDAVIDLTVIGGTGSITLLGFDMANLDAADFLF
ncbi:calcium-binding protein [Mesobacterium pallidum]|uniref:calcium-binding protein n=1 Tax=Mesobacterium pallidum TaxID=2872037 RepID=UPI001EE2308E|nr:calcium-binding protein [Mesobacterium pallidum]